MAKVDISVDTTEKTMMVSVNGEQLDKVREVCIYYDEDAEVSEYGKLSMDLRMMEKMHGMSKVTRLVAKELKSKSDKDLQEHPKLKDFYIAESNSLVADEIQKFLEKF